MKSSERILGVQVLPLLDRKSLKLVINDTISTKSTHRAPNAVIAEHLTVSRHQYLHNLCMSQESAVILFFIKKMRHTET